MKQSFKNYIRFYTPHHFVFYPIMSILLGFGIYFAYIKDDDWIWIFISVLILSVIGLSYMMRQHYALTLQDRIIRLEVRYRYFATTGKRFEDYEHGLNDSQIFALRFCPDSQLDAMTKKAFTEKLSGVKIKQAISDWQADNHRV